jgi:hypothetical protein
MVHALAVNASQDIMVHVVSPVQQASMAVQKWQVCLRQQLFFCAFIHFYAVILHLHADM